MDCWLCSESKRWAPIRCTSLLLRPFPVQLVALLDLRHDWHLFEVQHLNEILGFSVVANTAIALGHPAGKGFLWLWPGTDAGTKEAQDMHSKCGFAVAAAAIAVVIDVKCMAVTVFDWDCTTWTASLQIKISSADTAIARHTRHSFCMGFATLLPWHLPLCKKFWKMCTTKIVCKPPSDKI